MPAFFVYFGGSNHPATFAMHDAQLLNDYVDWLKSKGSKNDYFVGVDEDHNVVAVNYSLVAAMHAVPP